jgi:hypothetical protein
MPRRRIKQDEGLSNQHQQIIAALEADCERFDKAILSMLGIISSVTCLRISDVVALWNKEPLPLWRRFPFNISVDELHAMIVTHTGVDFSQGPVELDSNTVNNIIHAIPCTLDNLNISHLVFLISFYLAIGCLKLSIADPLVASAYRLLAGKTSDKLQLSVEDIRKNYHKRISSRLYIRTLLFEICYWCILAMATLFLGTDTITRKHFPAYAVVIIITELLETLARRTVIYLCQRRHRQMAEKLNIIKKHLESATQLACQKHQQGRIENSYFVLQVEKYKTISCSMRASVIKSILLKHGIHIIAYNNTEITVCSLGISASTAASIRNEIQQVINRLEQIKKLEKILSHLASGQWVRMLETGSDHLPQVKYSIEITSDHFDKRKLAAIFTSYNFAQYTLHEEMPQPTASVSIPAISALPPSTAVEIVSAPLLAASKKVSPPDKDKNKVEKPILQHLFRFPFATYDSRDPKCRVKPLNSDLFGKDTHFIIFNIPEVCIPHTATYLAMKEKIEEAMLARASHGSQGLQFREEWVHDDTDPKHRLYKSSMRFKFLGAKGDARAYAEKESDGNGHYLYVFKSVQLKTH